MTHTIYVRKWAEMLAKYVNNSDWPILPDGFEPFVISIAAEALAPHLTADPAPPATPVTEEGE